MKLELLLDSADLTEIKDSLVRFDIDGVTTNPTILSKIDCQDPIKHLIEISNIIGEDKMLHIQVLSTKTSEIVQEAKRIKMYLNNRGNLFIKIPVNNNGIEAMKILKNEGYKITATGIYNEMQIIHSARFDVDYVAPYVNRIYELGTDPFKVVSDSNRALKDIKSKTKIIGASFKEESQVKNTLLAGAQAITISYEMLNRTMKHKHTEKSIIRFREDFYKQFNTHNF